MAERNEFRETLLEFFFPTRCCFCRRLTGKNMPVCKACAARYPDRTGAQAERSLTASLRCFSPLRYEGEARRALLRFKFGGLRGYAPAFARLMRQTLAGSAVTADYVVWVPLSAKRLRERGYDQARLLAEALARGMQLPCEPLLSKTRHTRAQSGLHSREQRRANAAGAYCVPAPDRAAGRRLLLVDDIVTSGATLEECARMLRRAGAKSVTAVTAASRDG